MDHAQRLTETAEPANHPACPDCGAPAPSLPTPGSTLLEALPLRRCMRCGGRSSAEPSSRRVRECGGCELPYLESEADRGRCIACREQELAPPEQPEAALVAACEAEARNALAAAWSFVAAPDCSDYLRRVYHGLVRSMSGLPASGDVLLVRDDALRSLVLPSGVVILSTGTLEALKDEAQLAFVLSHELAHLASEEVATTWVRVGLRAMTLDRGPGDGSAWLEAALDILRLGYGDRREHAADELAIGTLAAAGYDLASVESYLHSLSARISRGEANVSELALSHPTPADRLRRVETLRSLRLPATTAVRNDREVFRRAAGHSALATELSIVEPFAEPYPSPGTGLRWWLFWTVVIVTFVAGLLVWGLF